MIPTGDPLLFVRHIRRAKLCMSGARTWFAQRGWSWSDFLSNGRAIRDFEETGCPLAARAVEKAVEEMIEDGQ